MSTTQYRGLDKLTPEFKEKVEFFINDDKIKDKIFITESYRSQERQNELYSQWRTTPWPVVTWTKISEHTKGTAIDIAFNWKELYPKDIYLWKEVAEVANEYGIDWGFDLWWTDKPHFQDNWKVLQVKSKYTNILDDLIEDWYNPIFSIHEWDNTLTEKEIKELIEISNARVLERVSKKREKVMKLLKNIITILKNKFNKKT